MGRSDSGISVRLLRAIEAAVTYKLRCSCCGKILDKNLEGWSMEYGKWWHRCLKMGKMKFPGVSDRLFKNGTLIAAEQKEIEKEEYLCKA